MSTHVVGIVPADEKYKQMDAIWALCEQADVHPPEEVIAFFRGERPDGAGVDVPIENTPAVEEWSEDTSSGFQVDITKPPENVKILRFYNSW